MRRRDRRRATGVTVTTAAGTAVKGVVPAVTVAIIAKADAAIAAPTAALLPVPSTCRAAGFSTRPQRDRAVRRPRPIPTKRQRL
jgi:hypothetical protein